MKPKGRGGGVGQTQFGVVQARSQSQARAGNSFNAFFSNANSNHSRTAAFGESRSAFVFGNGNNNANAGSNSVNGNANLNANNGNNTSGNGKNNANTNPAFASYTLNPSYSRPRLLYPSFNPTHTSSSRYSSSRHTHHSSLTASHSSSAPNSDKVSEDPDDNGEHPASVSEGAEEADGGFGDGDTRVNTSVFTAPQQPHSLSIGTEGAASTVKNNRVSRTHQDGGDPEFWKEPDIQSNRIKRPRTCSIPTHVAVMIAHLASKVTNMQVAQHCPSFSTLLGHSP
ncbi:hypothetical protein FB446DRAFT_790200 [Lentinula raphanica]|nr:hypothetical protein FB446DRAFT_790200 [Lentinula raphanica]